MRGLPSLSRSTTATMSVLTLLYAAQGHAYSAHEKRLRIDPRLQRQNHRSPLVLPGCWGEIRFGEKSRQLRLEIEVASGELPLSSIGPIAGAAGSVIASMNNEPLPTRVEQFEESFSLVLGDGVVISPGNVLAIELWR